MYLQECYGSKHPENVAKVKQLYNILGLPLTYKTYEEQTYALLCTQIQQITRGLPHKLFFNFLQKVYGKGAYILWTILALASVAPLGKDFSFISAMRSCSLKHIKDENRLPL